MKAWLKSFILTIALTIYIALGSLFFMLMEAENGRKRQADIRAALVDFIRNHSHCGVTGQVMKPLLEEISTARLHNAFVIDADSENHTHDAWSFENAYVFSFTVVTTIGFGWISPRSLGGQIFCIVYAIPGIVLNGYTLTTIGATFQSAWEKASQMFHRVTKSFTSKSARALMGFLFTALGLWFFLLTVPAIIFAQTENWPFLLTQYFSFITLSTIGFGDLTPRINLSPERQTVWGETFLRVGVMMFAFIGMALISIAFTALWRYQKKHTKRALDTTRLILIRRGVISVKVEEDTTPSRGTENNGFPETICD